MTARAAVLGCGATGGLLLLAWCDSLLLALLLGTFLAWSWLIDWCRGAQCSSRAGLQGKLALVTGANTGIGKETARGLAARGARVVLACRDVKKGEAAANDIRVQGGEVEVMHLDLASFASVRTFAGEFAAKFAKLDILVNNAGMAFQPRQLTEDGQEQVMQVNHLSHFLLTNLLLELLEAAGRARVVNLSSLAHTWAKQGIQWDDLKWEQKPFCSWTAYGQSKLANVLFTRELARRQARSGVTVYAVHPGAVSSELGRAYEARIPAFLRTYVTDLSKVFLKTAEGGAQTSLHCAFAECAEGETGKYYSDCAVKAESSQAKDDKQAKKLWEVSKGIVGDISPLKPSGIPEPLGASSLAATLKAATPEPPAASFSTPEPLAATPEPLAASLEASPIGWSRDVTESVSEQEEFGLSELSELQEDVRSQVQKGVVQDVLSFDRTELRQTETQEPLSGPQLAKRELEAKSLQAEVAGFDRAGLNVTEVEEKNVLPGHSDIQQEKAKIELIGGIENFDPESLARVSVKEPVGGAELVRQELGHKAVQEEIGAFGREGLRATEVREKNVLPDQQEIAEEREKVEHLAGIEGFDTEGLTKVRTLEPLSGVELLQRELTQKAVTEELGAFDMGGMKPTVVEERVVLPDTATLREEKARESLLAGLEQFPQSSLAHVRTPEPVTGAELARQELNIKSIVDSVTTFDSSSLRSATTEEKIQLPDASTLQAERSRAELLAALEGEHSLNTVVPKEPLGGVQLLQQELTRQQVLEGVEAFDLGGLRAAGEVQEALLPGAETIEAERSHVQHLAGIGGFDQSSLTPVKVAEPLSGSELVKRERAREELGEQLATFDRGELKETEVEEKVVLPGAEDIQAERQHLDLLHGLEEGVGLKKTETREPASPLDLARMELHKDQVEEELQAFDRARLTPVVTEERSFLPSAEELRAAEMEAALEVTPGGAEELRESLEAISGGAEGRDSVGATSGGAAGLREALSEDREQRSSSEEWEKVEGGDSEC